MTVDLEPVSLGANSVVELVIQQLPLAIAIVGVPTAITVGLLLGKRIVNALKSAFGGK